MKYVADAQFSKEPNSIIYVTAGKEIRLGWDYKIIGAERNDAFSTSSPTWSILDKEGQEIELCSEKKDLQWKWSVSQSCPDRYKGRIRKESGATLIISGATESDSGFYRCSLVMISGKPVISTVQVVVKKGN